MKVNRRELLKNAAFVSGAAMAGALLPSSRKLLAQDSLLNLPNLPSPENSGIEHIVVVTMENRSFDHFLGWLPNADGRRGDHGESKFRSFSRMAAQCGRPPSRLDVRGQRRREPRDSRALG